MYELIFTMSLGISQKLILGNLRLIYPDGTIIDYLATSGLYHFFKDVIDLCSK